jgi:hypothetical protein
MSGSFEPNGIETNGVEVDGIGNLTFLIQPTLFVSPTLFQQLTLIGGSSGQGPVIFYVPTALDEEMVILPDNSTFYVPYETGGNRASW